ncbi:AraC family transcriptional regulator [Paraburkholderia caballeronis]|uniref:AraC family transcriptional regulator n=1 Tax=Paraburkholderia caballeronis TaxID=416943 RepID=UPI001065DC98|nr:helix-turn-helix transcriptional regulator [Paraburkholderia caballeronis]TDV14392.1 AraC family transcriptional regulator [Paraburkholderia caballeronis]TDV15918.1 AraC family transcriptional regulator [Paraburkholderia caballeronis]TDV25179.1 AraC family transcriptional regulator [Paraburkholderia caballeronis]TDV34761.1 AraC family transcriptional regulator [Paraburkholderia caballeronis]
MPKALPPDLRAGPDHGRSLARHYPRGLKIDPHMHDWAQVLYAVSGVMWVETGREALVVPPQRAVWLPPGTLHGITMMSAVEMRNVYLHGRYVGHLSRECDVFEVNGLLRELIATLAEREAERDEAWLQTAYRLTVMELAHARRHVQRIPLPGGADRRLAMLCDAVIADPSLDVSFEQHAASVGASSRTLSRLFRRELGTGFAEWRRQVQLAVAVSRLAEGEPVSRVARSLGYLPSSFSDMFRRELGAPPTGFQATQTLKAPADEASAPAA